MSRAIDVAFAAAVVLRRPVAVAVTVAAVAVAAPHVTGRI